MQIVSYNLQEISKPILGENKKNISKYHDKSLQIYFFCVKHRAKKKKKKHFWKTSKAQ